PARGPHREADPGDQAGGGDRDSDGQGSEAHPRGSGQGEARGGPAQPGRARPHRAQRVPAPAAAPAGGEAPERAYRGAGETVEGRAPERRMTQRSLSGVTTVRE